MKVAIVGGASSAQNAPFDRDDWDIWVLGNQMQRYEGKRITRVFEIHEDLSEHDPAYPGWLIDFGIDLVVSDKFPACGHAMLFDYEEAAMMIGENFSSSPAVMFAQAIMDGATHISVYGVDMALDEHEYYMQRPSMEQWIGYAKGLGINVYIHESSPLGRSTYREGRDWPHKGFDGIDDKAYQALLSKHESAMEDIKKELNGLAAAEHRIELLRASYQAHDGARQAYDKLSKKVRAIKGGQDIDICGGVIHG